jgi:hypothetical protein
MGLRLTQAIKSTPAAFAAIEAELMTSAKTATFRDFRWQ